MQAVPAVPHSPHKLHPQQVSRTHDLLHAVRTRRPNKERRPAHHGGCGQVLQLARRAVLQPGEASARHGDLQLVAVTERRWRGAVRHELARPALGERDACLDAAVWQIRRRRSQTGRRIPVPAQQADRLQRRGGAVSWPRSGKGHARQGLLHAHQARQQDTSAALLSRHHGRLCHQVFLGSIGVGALLGAGLFQGSRSRAEQHGRPHRE